MENEKLVEKAPILETEELCKPIVDQHLMTDLHAPHVGQAIYEGAVVERDFCHEYYTQGKGFHDIASKVAQEILSDIDELIYKPLTEALGHADFRTGITAPCSYLDEGELLASQFFGSVDDKYKELKSKYGVE